MSAYCLPGFTLSVINSQNQIIRESNQNNVRTAYLEFGEEYRLRIKNKTDYRAYCNVMIDGMDVASGSRFLLQPKQTMDLERFVLDGDLTQGKRFKFVSIEEGIRTGEIQDPTNAANGLISVVFTPERPTPNILLNPYIRTNQDSIWAPSSVNCVNSAASGDVTFTSMSGFESVKITDDDERKGATVEGSYSNQNFRTDNTWFLTDLPITMMIQLKGKINHPLWTINDRGEVFYQGSKLTVDSYKIQPEGLQISVKNFSFVKA